MNRRIASRLVACGALATIVAGASGCAQQGRRPLTPAGLEHAREAYRGALAGTAMLLPILDCNARDLAILPNPDARSLVARTFPPELWSQLKLPGTPEDGRVDASDALCAELSGNEGKGTNLVLASPVMREQLRNLFTFHPDRQWVVAITRALKLEEHRETTGVQLSAYVFAPNGEVAFRGDLDCDEQSDSERHNCGGRYANAPQRIAELLDGFPLSILAGAKLLSAQPPEPETDAAPAASPVKRKSGKRRR